MNERCRIICGKLITMSGDEPVGPQVITVEQGRVVAIRNLRGDLDADEEGRVLDLSHLTVLPGLIDGHSHLEMIDLLAGSEPLQVQASDAALALRCAKNGLYNLRTGVTTMRLCGTKNFIDVDLRKSIETGDVPGPRLVIAGRGIASSLTENVNQVTANGVDAVARATRENIFRGADFIKVFASGGTSPSLVHATACYYSDEELGAIARTAHEFGIPVTAHAYGGPGVESCFRAGFDAIEHGIFMTRAQFDRMAELGLWLTGTLGVFLTEPGLAEILPPAARERFLKAREATWVSIREAKRAGVKFALGTDAIHGTLAQEVIFASTGGMSNREALAAITCNAAKLCRLEGEVGVIAPGARADLVAVDGDPLDDIASLKAVRLVMKGGQAIA